jgi:hypothetical protein
MRRVRRPLDDQPSRQPHPLQDGRGNPLWQAPIELRPQVSAQHLFGGPGDRPFGRFGVGRGVGIGHVPIGEQDGNMAQATGGCAVLSKANIPRPRRRTVAVKGIQVDPVRPHGRSIWNFDSPSICRNGERSGEKQSPQIVNWELSYWRPGPESNRRTRICSPLHGHSATGPEAAGSGVSRRGGRAWRAHV